MDQEIYGTYLITIIDYELYKVLVILFTQQANEDKCL